ncbi:MAG: sigma-70 family RNA polymerase sigma factor, partial [Chloroflexi bacterium]|nr:sigma-70 family RNA polymerase sigma factor [Chloroflexota bacterium]
MAVTHVAPAVREERAAVDSQIAEAVCALLIRGDRLAAGERFAEIVERHQRRATRIAYYYLRDPAEVDEAVQDAFLKAFVNIRSFRERLYFELWFTRILVNGCLDRLKSRARRNRW